MRNESLRRGWAWQVRISLVLLLGLSAIAQETGASTLVAGFLAGMVLVRLHESDRLTVQFMGVANGFFVPLFFVLLGAELNLRALLTSPSRILLALGLAVAAVVTHVIAARVAGHEKYLATGLAASAQLGMPAAAASLGLSTGLLSPAEAAALVAGGCLTLIPATIGSLLLARGAPATPTTPTTPRPRSPPRNQRTEALRICGSAPSTCEAGQVPSRARRPASSARSRSSFSLWSLRRRSSA